MKNGGPLTDPRPCVICGKAHPRWKRGEFYSFRDKKDDHLPELPSWEAYSDTLASQLAAEKDLLKSTELLIQRIANCPCETFGHNGECGQCWPCISKGHLASAEESK